MNKKLSMAVASAVMAFGASAANAGIIIPAGDWTLDIGGNINTFFTETRVTGDAVDGLGGISDTGTRSVNNITTGLLPNYLSVSGKTRQNDLDVGFTISIQPGSSTKNAGIQNGSGNQENRQAFLTFGDKSWGSIKLGKDIGVYAQNAILNDMTLLGVGSAAGALAGNTTTLGRIGTGFIYADWKSQITYWSPNWNGFSFVAGVTQAWNVLGGGALGGASSTGRGGSQPAYEGMLQYEWAGDVAGKVWASGISQKVTGMNGTLHSSDRADAWDLGAHVDVAGFGLTGYYGQGQGTGTVVQFNQGYDATGNSRDSDDWYVQGTYVIPGVGTKLGVSYGRSTLDGNNVDGFDKFSNRMWTLGAYHPLTKHLNLVAEYSDVKAKVEIPGASDLSGKSRTISLGAIMFF